MQKSMQEGILVHCHIIDKSKNTANNLIFISKKKFDIHQRQLINYGIIRHGRLCSH